MNFKRQDEGEECELLNMKRDEDESAYLMETAENSAFKEAYRSWIWKIKTYINFLMNVFHWTCSKNYSGIQVFLERGLGAQIRRDLPPSATVKQGNSNSFDQKECLLFEYDSSLCVRGYFKWKVSFGLHRLIQVSVQLILLGPTRNRGNSLRPSSVCLCRLVCFLVEIYHLILLLFLPLAILPVPPIQLPHFCCIGSETSWARPHALLLLRWNSLKETFWKWADQSAQRTLLRPPLSLLLRRSKVWYRACSQSKSFYSLELHCRFTQ